MRTLNQYAPVCLPKTFLILFGFAMASSLATGAIPLVINAGASNQLKIQRKGHGEIELTTMGEDPFLVLDRARPEDTPPTHTILAFDYFAPREVNGLTVNYGPPMHGARQFAAGKLPSAETWMPCAIDLESLSGGKWSRTSPQLRIDFGHRSGITFRVRGLQLRAPNQKERVSQAERESERKNKLVREKRLNAFYKAKFPHRIEHVGVGGADVVIRGQIAGEHELDARLIELRPEISIADHASNDGGGFVLDDHRGIQDAGSIAGKSGFEMSLPRRKAKVDRITSRWAIAGRVPNGKWQLLSHWKYATDLSAAAAHDLPRQVPGSVKGMGGVHASLPLEDLVELGVHSITVNILLSGLIDTVPHERWIPFEHGGREWYLNPGRLAGYDKLTKFAAANKMVVSGILLVNFLDNAHGRMLVHPEADRAGRYAMPNFTSAEGVAAYEAVIECLARRYAAPGAPHGRIANWIIHNEIGHGWQWTNMGWQPPMLYMDHYLRSMRLVHDVTRRHDPHARVFVSLTHHWNMPSDPLWKFYSNVDFLKRLIESSRVEGDFAWGVAYHPYPQNLRRPDAWNDARVTNDFDTPFITPKNIAVLDRWMHRPEMRDSAGKVRGLLLSEQGFNTPDYSMENQRLQAAGFVYMWRQMRGLKSIEAFHNHRWVDAPREGGLLLGLRKLPAKGKPFGEKKFSWQVYKMLGTPGEEEASRFADGILGKE